MIEPPINLLFRVEDLGSRLKDAVEHRRWTDVALAAAGMLQATDDALSRTSSVLVVAAGKARARSGLAGRLTAVALDTVVRLSAVPAPAGLSLSRTRPVGRWREGLAELAVAAAELSLLPRDDDDGRPQAQQAGALLRQLEGLPSGLREAVARIPSCFRAFDQHPDDVAALVAAILDRWPDRSRPVVVVGIRTSGSYLAPFAVAAFRRAGCSAVTMVSARPDQRTPSADARTLRAAGRRGALVVVVDDPPTSGGAVARVCAELMRLGIARTSIVPALALFDDAPALPATLSAFPSVTLPWPEWSIHHRLGPERVARQLTDALAPATVTGIRALARPAPLARTHAQRLYEVDVGHDDGRTETRRVLAAGTGLGYYGEHDVVVAQALSGHVPAVVSARDGVLCMEWPDDGDRGAPSSSGVADYIAVRHDALPVTRDLTAGLRGRQPVWEVASNHLARTYGRFWPVARVLVVDRLTRHLLRTAAPSVPDGDMRPTLWAADPASGRPLKLGFTDRAFSNFDLVCVDDAFDVVGAAVHDGDPRSAQGLREAYEKRTGRGIASERWLLYELVHLWDLQRHGTLDPPTVRHRKSQALRRYLAEVLLSGIECRADGPVVALDVDGVVETDILGFEAPTPASVMCLRALHAHGYRTVLATGRCLDDAVQMSDLFGLAGAAAEYGSVLYDRRSARVSPTVTDAALSRLDEFRETLSRQPCVRIDPRHRYSVRASAVDAGGRLRGFVPDPGAVPEGLRAVVGEGQTDFVPATVDKARGVRLLLQEWGAGRPVLAVGDTSADLPLLAWAATSAVPQHAEDVVKAVATRVSRHPYQAGLQDAVSGLLGHRPGGCARCSPPALSDDTRALLQLLRVPEGTRLQALARTVPLARPLRNPV
ncbi:MAG TPA: HAD hydrolase family protein [Blastococcus sp.]